MSERKRPNSPERAQRGATPPKAGAPKAESSERRSPQSAILTSLQIETPLEEFRRHFQKRRRSFEGTGGGRAVEVYRRAFELAEQLIRKQRGGDER